MRKKKRGEWFKAYTVGEKNTEEDNPGRITWKNVPEEMVG